MIEILRIGIKTKVTIAVCLCISLFTPALSAAECLANRSDQDVGVGVSEAPLRIGKISISPNNMFDTATKEEGYRVHRLANSLHYRTRPSTVLQALPFKEGDLVMPGLFAETERLLRKKKYIRDATILPTELCDGTVDVWVKTIDNWTLTPSISFSSAGGQERYKFEMQDVNSLGSGKELKYFVSKDEDGKRRSALYKDDNWRGSQRQLSLSGGNNDAGKHFGFRLERPFVTANTESAWRLNFSSEHLSNEVESVDQIVQVKDFDLFFAAKKDSKPEVVSRIGVGVRQQSEETVEGVVNSENFNFDDKFPYLFFSWDKSFWQKRSNYKSFGKVEDLQIGTVANVEFGLISQVLGNDLNAIRLEANYQYTWEAKNSDTNKFSIRPILYLSSDKYQKWSLRADYEHYRKLSEKNQITTRFLFEKQRGYSSIHEFEIGGSHGLSGYPDAYQAGNNRSIARTELRHVTNWRPYNLADTALHAFAEVGQIGTADTTHSMLANVGFGLALSPTRSSRLSVLRFDFVFPVSSTDDIDGFQIYVGSSVEY